MTASHSRLVLPAHVSLSLQIAAGPLNTRDGECIIDAPHENAATHNFSVPPRNGLLRQAQTQSSVRLYRCGAIELSATRKRRRNSRKVRRGTLSQWCCAHRPGRFFSRRRSRCQPCPTNLMRRRKAAGRQMAAHAENPNTTIASLPAAWHPQIVSRAGPLYLILGRCGPLVSLHYRLHGLSVLDAVSACSWPAAHHWSGWHRWAIHALASPHL
jgi:hypothetical protein